MGDESAVLCLAIPVYRMVAMETRLGESPCGTLG